LKCQQEQSPSLWKAGEIRQLAAARQNASIYSLELADFRLALYRLALMLGLLSNILDMQLPPTVPKSEIWLAGKCPSLSKTFCS
jgi:hypothetical protein